MAGSVNKVTLVGNLGKDPEIRNTQAGMKIVNLAVATSDSWNDKASGERKEQTEWHRVVIMNDRLADVAEKYLRKGSKVYLEGKLQTRKWTDTATRMAAAARIMPHAQPPPRKPPPAPPPAAGTRRGAVQWTWTTKYRFR